MAERDNSNERKEPVQLEAPVSNELANEDLEDVAGGATSCTPDQPTILPSDDFYIPLDPML